MIISIRRVPYLIGMILAILGTASDISRSHDSSKIRPQSPPFYYDNNIIVWLSGTHFTYRH